MKLDRKVALITGSSSGIGKAIAERFAREGARVAVVASSNPEKAARVAAAISKGPGAAFPFVADVTKADQVERLVKAVEETAGPIDIVVNCAGVLYPTPLGAADPDQVRKIVDVSLIGSFLVMNAVVPAMKARGSGQIINISSSHALVPTATYSAYGAVKAAIIALSRAAAVELGPFGIHVNTIAPGNTVTPMTEFARTSPEAAARREWIAKVTPSTRHFTPPEEIAAAALFLVSGEVKAIYGAVLTLDEGRSAGLPPV